MIDAIKTFMRQRLHTRDAVKDSPGVVLRMATAVLLMEVARADHNVDETEREIILRIIERQHALSSAEARRVAAAAEEKIDKATSLYPFTSMINRDCSLEERVAIVSMLWEVTFADGRVDDHEEHLVRRVANLLHVPHREFIRTKLQHSGM
jgi:uncharacterized tellurite resistance protein B-like protein